MKVRFVTTNRVAFSASANILRDVLDAVVRDLLEVRIGSFAHGVRLKICEGHRSCASGEDEKSGALEMHGGSVQVMEGGGLVVDG